MTTDPDGSQRREKVRSILILGGCLVVVLGLLGAALIPYLDDEEDVPLAELAIPDIGASAGSADCDAIATTPTDMTQEHVRDGVPVDYAQAPPAYGRHSEAGAAFGRPFYTRDDRPGVANLVHNLEHGFTIAWYDETIAGDEDQLEQLEAVAMKYQDELERFIAAPWTSEDGAGFPDGKHVALTRWTAAAEDPADLSLQRGNWQYCGSVSGAVISEFFETWPNAESPEPGIPVG